MYKTPGLSTPNRGQNAHNCDYGNRPPPGMVCDVDIKDFGSCIQENHYNYHRSSPCIFLKLNKIFGWRPNYFTANDTLPHNMPKDLKEYIADIRKNNPIQVSPFSSSSDLEL